MSTEIDNYNVSQFLLFYRRHLFSINLTLSDKQEEEHPQETKQSIKSVSNMTRKLGWSCKEYKVVIINMSDAFV